MHCIVLVIAKIASLVTHTYTIGTIACPGGQLFRHACYATRVQRRITCIRALLWRTTNKGCKPYSIRRKKFTYCIVITILTPRSSALKPDQVISLKRLDKHSLVDLDLADFPLRVVKSYTTNTTLEADCRVFTRNIPPKHLHVCSKVQTDVKSPPHVTTDKGVGGTQHKIQ